MPTISTDSIEGFAEMTAEQKVEALLKLEVPEKVDLSGYVKKDLFDRTSSELAEKKRQDKAKMSESDAMIAELKDALAQSQEAVKAVTEQLEEQQRVNKVATFKSKYLALGYDEKLAEDAAKAMADGDTEKVFEIQKKAAEEAEKARKKAEMHANPHPTGAGGGNDTGEPENIKRAKELGKARANAHKDSNDILENYL